ncbi:MAG: hypothetical protein ORN58_04775 [Sediminibacterium sp.]|nr:hypothetical protein [Sediminibacterium sp.]
MNFDDFKLYLPKYLSSESDKELFNCLKDFPCNIDKRLYSSKLFNEEILYQGDGIKDLLVINLPDNKIDMKNCMLLSNTCDIDLINKRFFPSQIIYAPIFNLNKYNEILSKSSKTQQQINEHILAIKKQSVTQIFYLPKNGSIDESIVFLDRINNICNTSISRKKIIEQRLFTLSNYGLYLFLFKLSIHFTRIQEKIDR